MNEALPDGNVNLAFLGCGEVVRLHSRTLASPGFHVGRFYASRDAGRAREYDTRFDGSGWFHSYESAIRDERIQVVLVATPPSTHLELTLQALEGGKHVIVEKPAFLRPQELDLVEERAERSGRRVFVAENYVYKPVAFHLRKIIRDGSLGAIRFLHINALKEQETSGWRGDPALAGGGALFEGGIHWISFLGSLGLEAEGVWASRVGDRSGGDRSALVTLRYRGGAVGTLHFSWEIRAPFRAVRLSRIYGTEGSVLFESNGLFLLRTRWGPPRRSLPSAVLPGFRDLLGYRAMFSDFFHAVNHGSPSFYTLAHARKDLERIQEVHLAMDGGAPHGDRQRSRRSP